MCGSSSDWQTSVVESGGMRTHTLGVFGIRVVKADFSCPVALRGWRPGGGKAAAVAVEFLRDLATPALVTEQIGNATLAPDPRSLRRNPFKSLPKYRD
jgi:hypothetical protein